MVSAANVPARLVESDDWRRTGCRTADACRPTDRTPSHTTHTRRSRFDFVARSMTSGCHERRPPRPWPVGECPAALGYQRWGLGVRRRQHVTSSRRDRWPGSSLEYSRPPNLGREAARTGRGIRRLSFHALGRRAVQGAHRSNRRRRRRAHRLSRPRRRSVRIRHVRQLMTPQKRVMLERRTAAAASACTAGQSLAVSTDSLSLMGGVPGAGTEGWR
jgi:hypothetical protein